MKWTGERVADALERIAEALEKPPPPRDTCPVAADGIHDFVPGPSGVGGAKCRYCQKWMKVK